MYLSFMSAKTMMSGNFGILAVPCFDQGDTSSETLLRGFREYSQSGQAVLGKKVMRTLSNSTQESKKEETKIPQHKLDFVREQLKVLFNHPACNIFSCPNSCIL